MKKKSSFFTYFVQLCVIFLLSSTTGVMANGCKNIVWLKQKSDSYLRNHTINNMTVSSQTMCRVMCYLSDSCLSCNFHQSTSTCGISDSDEFQHPEDLIPMEGYIYTGTDNGCQSNPCPSNSTGCQANFKLTKGYKCLCPNGFTGPSCNTDVDECSSETHNCSKGSKCENVRGSFQCLASGTKGNPATSCLDILKAGNSNGDGEYWIDPSKTGSPIPAFCDMTTDGGGWTVVSKLVQPSNTALPHLSLHTYEIMKEYNRTDVNIIPMGAAMLDIKNKMGFNQIHFYCHKVSVGRVVSIMTKNNTEGQAVVSYFTTTGVATHAPKACGSFDRLPDDTSILSRDCSAWGDGTDEWGGTCCMGPMRMAAIAFGNRPKYTFEFIVYFKCDNPMENKFNQAVQPDVNDKWQISVR